MPGVKVEDLPPAVQAEVMRQLNPKPASIAPPPEPIKPPPPEPPQPLRRPGTVDRLEGMTFWQMLALWVVLTAVLLAGVLVAVVHIGIFFVQTVGAFLSPSKPSSVKTRR